MNYCICIINFVAVHSSVVAMSIELCVASVHTTACPSNNIGPYISNIFLLQRVM
jgi:hypothetical protein